MSKKLTLLLDDSIISSAKIYAHENNTSLSQLVQSFLKLITKKDKNKTIYSPITSELLGVLRSAKKINHKKDYENYLSEKYK